MNVMLVGSQSSNKTMRLLKFLCLLVLGCSLLASAGAKKAECETLTLGLVTLLTHSPLPADFCSTLITKAVARSVPMQMAQIRQPHGEAWLTVSFFSLDRAHPAALSAQVHPLR